MLRTHCEICGKKVEIPETAESRVRRYKKSGKAFCSRKCINIYVSQINKARGNTLQLARAGEAVKCGNCGKTIQTVSLNKVQRGQLKRGEGIYCCHECGMEEKRRKARERGAKARVTRFGEVLKCSVCGQDINVLATEDGKLLNYERVGRIYCSNKCAKEFVAEVARRQSPEQNRLFNHLKEKIKCEKEFSISLGVRKKGYPTHYKVDIAIPSQKIAIECDGRDHRISTVIAKDKKKEKKLEELGWKVLRYWNQEILDDVNSIVTQIMSIVSK